MNKLTYRVVMEIAAHEAVVRQAYKDSVGVWTWSVGITSASGHSVERYIDNPQPLERCLEVYVWLLEKYAKDVRAAFTRTLTEEQFAAALSFHWNTGAIKRASWVRHFNAGDMVRAKEAFMFWSNPPEIVGRRKAERDLFFYGKWSHGSTMTEYTRVRKGGRIDWGSAKKVEVKAILERLLDGKGSGAVEVPSVRRDKRQDEALPAPEAKDKAGKLTLFAGLAALAAVLANEFKDWIAGLF